MIETCSFYHLNVLQDVPVSIMVILHVSDATELAAEAWESVQLKSYCVKHNWRKLNHTTLQMWLLCAAKYLNSTQKLPATLLLHNLQPTASDMLQQLRRKPQLMWKRTRHAVMKMTLLPRTLNYYIDWKPPRNVILSPSSLCLVPNLFGLTQAFVKLS